MKGNRTNHRIVYARAKDLEELKDAFIDFKNKEYHQFKRMVLYCFAGLYVAVIAAFLANLLVG